MHFQVTACPGPLKNTDDESRLRFSFFPLPALCGVRWPGVAQRSRVGEGAALNVRQTRPSPGSRQKGASPPSPRKNGAREEEN